MVRTSYQPGKDKIRRRTFSGVLERADTMGFVADFALVLKQLKTSGFFVAESLEQQLLQRHRQRKGIK